MHFTELGLPQEPIYHGHRTSVLELCFVHRKRIHYVLASIVITAALLSVILPLDFTLKSKLNHHLPTGKDNALETSLN
jgi:hypothetical protein